MPYLDFRVQGLHPQDLRRRKKRLRTAERIALVATIAVWAAAGLSFVYTANARRTRARPPTEYPAEAVVETVPPSGSQSIPVCAPSIFFLDKPYEGDLDYSLRAKDLQGKVVDLTGDIQLVLLKSSRANPVVALVSRRPYPEGTVTAEILQKDTSGKTVFQWKTEFTVGKPPILGSTGAVDFEGDNSTFSGQGDIDFVSEKGALKARMGATMAVFSTGRVLGKGALDETTSILSLGPLPVGSERVRLQLDYDFISSEFDQYVGTEYDDAFLVVVAGPQGAQAGIVTSVNLVGKDASAPLEFPGLPEGNELPPQHTGWQTFSLSAYVGTPVCVSFVLTDVGDNRYTSVVAADALRIE